MNTYLSLTALAVADLNNLPVASISTFNALRDYDVIPDTLNPELEDFDLDVGTAALTLFFSKPMFVNTLMINQIIIQDAITASNQYPMTTSTEGPVIEIDLSFADATVLRESNVTATFDSTTYITVTSLAMDINGNTVVNINDVQLCNVRHFTSDTIPPVILSYLLHLNDGALLLTFDENITAVNQIQNSPVSPDSIYTLSASSSIDVIMDNIVSINNGQDDFNREF